MVVSTRPRPRTYVHAPLPHTPHTHNTHAHAHAHVQKHTCVHAHTRAIVLGKILLLTISHVVDPHAFELNVEILRQLTILKKGQLLFLM